MKYLILCILGLILCILGILASYLSLDREWFRDVQLDNLELYIYEDGRIVQHSELQLNDEEKEKLKTWLEAFDEGHVDFNSYAPSVVLKGKTFQINIMEAWIVFGYIKGSDSAQFSRPGTADDQHIRSWLKQISLLKGKPI